MSQLEKSRDDLLPGGRFRTRARKSRRNRKEVQGDCDSPCPVGTARVRTPPGLRAPLEISLCLSRCCGQPPAAPDDLLWIPGVGSSTVKKHGAAICRVCGQVCQSAGGVNRRRDAIQDQDLQPGPIRRLFRQRQLIHSIPLSSERYWAISVVMWTLPQGQRTSSKTATGEMS